MGRGTDEPFRVVAAPWLAPGETLSLGVSLTTAEGPVLKAYFKAERRPLSSVALLGQFFRLPFQSATVVGGIHWEALKLWLKGLNLQTPP